MPSATRRLKPGLRYSIAAFHRIAAGAVPRVMEDKWFIFYEEPCLHFHRSWTGDAIFAVRWKVTPKEAQVVEVLVNADPKQYRGRDDAADVALVKRILDSLAARSR